MKDNDVLLLVGAGAAAVLLVGVLTRKGARVRLSPHFSLREATVSRKAADLGLDNTPTPVQLANMQWTAMRVAEPLRALLGRMNIHSWFRAPAVNAAVNGSDTSDHLHGMALDFDAGDWNSAAAFDRIRESGLLQSLPIDQLIWYVKRNHLHVGAADPTRGVGRNPRHAAYIDHEDGSRLDRIY